MSEYLIISDTHGQKPRLRRLIRERRAQIKNGEPLRVIFLGDGLADLFSLDCYTDLIVWAVRGNCDVTDRISPVGEVIHNVATVPTQAGKIFIAHGHTYSVKSGIEEICREASASGADAVIFGHTHAPTLEYIKKGSIRGVERNLILFNPGALSGYVGSFGNLYVSESGFLFSHGSCTYIC